MADFCKQCSIDNFDKDLEEFAGLITPEKNEEGLYALAICEGCGVTLVDASGKCVGKCLLKHGNK